MRFWSLLVIAGCAGTEMTPDASTDFGPEITAQQVDPEQGRCVGVVDSNPTWAHCDGTCDLGEQQCLVTPSCRAVYADDLRTAVPERIFRACFPIAPAAGIPAARCVDLDALACSARDDCTAVHEGLFIYTPFLRCEPETCHVHATTNGSCGLAGLQP